MSEPQRHPLHKRFSEHEEELFRFLAWKVGNEDAADLLQEVYLRALEFSGLSGIRNLRAFLFRIASNLVIDTYRRRQTHANHHAVPTMELEEIQAPAPGPEAMLSGQMELKRLLALLGDLPPMCRYAFLLNRVDGLTHAQIAERLGISKKSVERHIHRALTHCLNGIDP